jgi:uncharacterized protein YciI
MPFQIYCIDDPAKPGLREKMRATHLRYMIKHRDRILFGGPIRDEAGRRSIGSAFAVDFKSRDEVDRFLAEEPYCIAGVFSSVAVHPMIVMVPERSPGSLEEELRRELSAAENSTLAS